MKISDFYIDVGKYRYKISKLGRGTEKDTIFFNKRRARGRKYIYAGVYANINTFNYERFYLYANNLKQFKNVLKSYIRKDPLK